MDDPTTEMLRVVAPPVLGGSFIKNQRRSEVIMKKVQYCYFENNFENKLLQFSSS